MASELDYVPMPEPLVAKQIADAWKAQIKDAPARRSGTDAIADARPAHAVRAAPQRSGREPRSRPAFVFQGVS